MEDYSIQSNGRIGRMVLDAELAANNFIAAPRPQQAKAEVCTAPLHADAELGLNAGQIITCRAVAFPEFPNNCCSVVQASGDAYAVAADARSGGQDSSGRVRRILVGHSLGAACAAAEAIDHPEVRRHLTALVAMQ